MSDLRKPTQTWLRKKTLPGNDGKKTVKIELFPADLWYDKYKPSSITLTFPVFLRPGDSKGFYRIRINGYWYCTMAQFTFFNINQAERIFSDAFNVAEEVEALAKKKQTGVKYYNPHEEEWQTAKEAADWLGTTTNGFYWRVNKYGHSDYEELFKPVEEAKSPKTSAIGSDFPVYAPDKQEAWEPGKWEKDNL
jgi:hypothetical protein